MLKRIKSTTEEWVSSYRQKLLEKNLQQRLTMCKKCYTFYYRNSWHFEKPDYLNLDVGEEVSVRFTECPACLEQDVAFYETEANLVLGRG